MIHARRPWTAVEVEGLIDAVYRGQREALKVPADDRNIRYVEHDPAHFAVPPDATERFILIEITLFPGRSVEAKTALQRNIVTNLGLLGVAPGDVFVILNEPPIVNWAVRGVPGAELQIGFSLDV